MEFASAVTRLSDPEKAASSPRQLHELSEKISATITRLFRKPENGGNPFLFALTGPKPHELTRKIDTAATDGKKFYWNPDFLDKLDPNEAATIMAHEAYHVLFYHCTPERSGGYKPNIWNIAVDYVVNSVVETDHDKSGRNSKYKLWTGAIGPAIPLDHYLESIDGTRDWPDKGCFGDVTCYGRSPESIYDAIMKAMAQSKRKCTGPRTPIGQQQPQQIPQPQPQQAGPNGQQGQAQIGPSGVKACGNLSWDPKTGQSVYGPGPYATDQCEDCGAPLNGSMPGIGSLDSHLPSAQTKDETMGDMLRAAEQTRSMGRGDVPAGIAEALGLLGKPELTPRDIIRMMCSNKVIDKGNVNDWKRFRRRPEFIYEKDAEGIYQPKHRLYTPKKHDYMPKWVCLLDTSGSMSDEDLVHGVKELKLVSGVGEGWVVPCDATPYWDKATRITSTGDLARTQLVGRGGTVFTEFFRDLPSQKFGQNVDLLIIITDGDCGEIPLDLKPPGMDVLWIITNKRDFKPNFGRVCQLRPSRL